MTVGLKQSSATLISLIGEAERVGQVAQDDRQNDLIHGGSDVLVRQWRDQRPDLDFDALELTLRIRRLAMLLDGKLADLCEQLGLNLNEFLLLMALRRVGKPYSLRPTDILKLHSITSGTVTYRIDKLTSQGLAERVRDPSDLRGYLIQLTPHGLDIVDNGISRFAAAQSEMLGSLLVLPGAASLLVSLLRLYEHCAVAAVDTARAGHGNRAETIGKAAKPRRRKTVSHS